MVAADAERDAELTQGIRQRCERKDAKGGRANAGRRVHQDRKVRTQGKKSAEGRNHFLLVCSVINRRSKECWKEMRRTQTRMKNRK